MPKNVIIFSDGTGQAGGLRFDEDRSNIYKLYRATRCGPDSAVNPGEQVTFYDPGLGSPADGGHLFGNIPRRIYNVVSQATGLGITANIIDCYGALIRLWQPGDRIFLFGFSRGAYAVRCLAGVIALCGIPTRLMNGQPLRLDLGSTCDLAAYAVKHVYQFTSSRSYESASAYQKFLLDTRVLLGKRFREQCGSADNDKANVYPYFIGVFDTVAALGSFRTFVLFAGVFLAAAAAVGLFGQYLSLFPDVPVIGPLLARLSFWRVFGAIVGAAAVFAIALFVYTHVKFDFRVPGYTWRQSFKTTHVTEIWQSFYDYNLNENVGYAKHAISIDENRKDFARVPWGRKDEKLKERDALGNLWFEQVWFSGVHADVGGGYPENESRLSDSALKWMRDCATAVPNGIQYDPDVLMPFPRPDGVQHDEVKASFGIFNRLFHLTWAEKTRELPAPDAVMHRSVYDRFDLRAVQLYDHTGPYRPETLRNHVDFAEYYKDGAPFPATSGKDPKAVAADLPGRGAVARGAV
jgi:uncharacterized protein (DUF2235 family)